MICQCVRQKNNIPLTSFLVDVPTKTFGQPEKKKPAICTMKEVKFNSFLPARIVSGT